MNYCLRNTVTGKRLMKRGKPVIILNPTDEHLQRVIAVTNRLTGATYEAVPTVYRVQ